MVTPGVITQNGSQLLPVNDNLAQIAANGTAAQAASREALGIPPSLIPVTAITLSSLAFNTNQLSASVGTLAAPFSATFTFATAPQTGCAGGSSADNASFLISGTALTSNGAQLPSATQGSYKACIKATPVGGGSPIYQSFSISGIESPGTSASLLSLHPGYTCGTNYYVATTGNDSNPGTQGAPWLTLARAQALSLVGPNKCVNVAAGTYAAGIHVTAGGSSSAANGFMVYRCDAAPKSCILTDDGSGSGLDNGPFEFYGDGPIGKYVIIDGFKMTPSSTGQFGIGVTIFSPTSIFTTHHIVVMNSQISGYGQSGISAGYNDYLWVLHNEIHDTSAQGCLFAQGSGISMITPVLAPGYSPVAYDTNNPMIGNVTAVGISGRPARNVWNWNVIYNTALVNCAVAHTDANGLIADTWTHDGISDGFPNYEGGLLASRNVVYNNGGGGLHNFKSGLITFESNSVYNNYIDPEDIASFRGSFDDNGGYLTTFVDNLSIALACPTILPFRIETQPYCAWNTSFLSAPLYAISTFAGAQTTALTASVTLTDTTVAVASNAAFPQTGKFMISIDNEMMLVTSGAGTNTWTVTRAFSGYALAPHTRIATTLNGAINSSTTSITVTSGASFPAGVQFQIAVDDEIMLVTAGPTGTGWTVIRGYHNSVKASHADTAVVATPAVIWVPDYVASNMTATGLTVSGWGVFYSTNGLPQYGAGALYFGIPANDNGQTYNPAINFTNIDPQWVDVGTTSAGTQTTPPSGVNFALSPTSPAIGKGISPIPAELNWQASDLGACRHELTVCP